MAIEHLPRPWLLAALADVPVAILTQDQAKEAEDPDRPEDRLPRAEARRRRLSARHLAEASSEAWHGEDCWCGAERWRDLEGERAN